LVAISPVGLVRCGIVASGSRVAVPAGRSAIAGNVWSPMENRRSARLFEDGVDLGKPRGPSGDLVSLENGEILDSSGERRRCAPTPPDLFHST
jgi:hypothetical protein